MAKNIRLLLLMLACGALILVFRMPNEWMIAASNLTIAKKSQSDDVVLPESNHHNNLEWKKYHGKPRKKGNN